MGSQNGKVNVFHVQLVIMSVLNKQFNMAMPQKIKVNIEHC